jgi:anti-anti-sigma factor
VGSTGQAVLELRRPGLHRLDEVQQQVDVLLERAPRTLVVDLSKALHTSSSTIAALMCVRRRASARGVDVVLRAADRRLVDTLERSGLLDALAMGPTSQESRGDSHDRDPATSRPAPRRRVRRVEPGTSADADPTPEVGVTRLDLVCGPQVAQTAQELTRRWAQDRALSTASSKRLASLVLAAVAHGLRFDPRSLTITMRWLDPDRVRVDVRWKGCSGTARTSEAEGDLESTAGTLDAFAQEWGFGTSSGGPIQWMVLDTR